jgi:hypothetical protein
MCCLQLEHTLCPVDDASLSLVMALSATKHSSNQYDPDT